MADAISEDVTDVCAIVLDMVQEDDVVQDIIDKAVAFLCRRDTKIVQCELVTCDSEFYINVNKWYVLGGVGYFSMYFRAAVTHNSLAEFSGVLLPEGPLMQSAECTKNLYPDAEWHLNAYDSRVVECLLTKMRTRVQFVLNVPSG